MQTAAELPEAPTAIRTDLGAIFVSLELSRSTWLITSLSPGGRDKMSKHSVRGGDVPELLSRFKLLQKKAQARTGKLFPIVAIQEAGLDDFWIHRRWRQTMLKAMLLIRHRLRPRADIGARKPIRSTAKPSSEHCLPTREANPASAPW